MHGTRIRATPQDQLFALLTPRRTIAPKQLQTEHIPGGMAPIARFKQRNMDCHPAARMKHIISSSTHSENDPRSCRRSVDPTFLRLRKLSSSDPPQFSKLVQNFASTASESTSLQPCPNHTIHQIAPQDRLVTSLHQYQQHPCNTHTLWQQHSICLPSKNRFREKFAALVRSSAYVTISPLYSETSNSSISCLT